MGDAPQQPEPIELDCPYCEKMVACRPSDDVVTCPHCGKRCRQESDYLDESGNPIFALVPLKSGDDPGSE